MNIKKQAMNSMFVKIISLILSFILQIALARLLGTEGFGNYMLIMSWIFLLSTIALFGIGDTIIKYVSEYFVKEKFSLLNNFILFVRIKTFFIMFFILILGIVYNNIYLHYENKEIILISSLFIVFTLYQIDLYFLRAINKAVKSMLYNGIIKTILFLFLIFISWYFFNCNSFKALFLQMIVLLVIIIIFRFKEFRDFSNFLKIKSKNIVEKSMKKIYIKEWFYYSFALFIISLANELMRRADILMLGYYENSYIVGIYSAAMNFSMLLLFGLQAINSFSAQMIATLYTQNKLEELQRKLDYISKMIFLITIPIFLLYIIFGKYFLYLYGKDFVLGYKILLILSLAQVSNALVGPVGYIMNMTGHQKQASIIFIIGAFLNIILNIILIPHYGMYGAAIATLFSITFWNFSLYIYIKKKIGLYTMFIRI